jgi:hypothetical protein
VVDAVHLYRSELRPDGARYTRCEPRHLPPGTAKGSAFSDSGVPSHQFNLRVRLKESAGWPQPPGRLGSPAALQPGRFSVRLHRSPRKEPSMAISKELLDILACPACKADVRLTAETARA